MENIELESKYKYLKKINSHEMYLNDETNNTVLVKEYYGKSYFLLEQLKNLNTLNIPNIEKIIKKEDKIYSVEEYIQGINLREYRDRYQIKTVDIIDMCLKLVDILVMLSEKEIIHRDIKPDNIIVKKNEVYLIDFNISRIYKDNTTLDTELFGTKGFASPEQFGYEQTTYKSDVYSLGKTLSFMYEKSIDKNYDLQKLINKMISFSPRDRPEYESIKKKIKEINLSKEDKILKTQVKTENIYIPYIHSDNDITLKNISLYIYVLFISMANLQVLIETYKVKKGIYLDIYYIIICYLTYFVIKNIYIKTKQTKIYNQILNYPIKDSNKLLEHIKKLGIRYVLKSINLIIACTISMVVMAVVLVLFGEVFFM